MTSNQSNYTEAFVWVWLPGETIPVVAGRLARDSNTLVFNYGRSYLENEKAISIHAGELPLRPGVLPLLNGLNMPGCIRDGAPDAWGRRVIINAKLGIKGQAADVGQFDELTYLLESGSDRIGALDFQRSATDYQPRFARNAALEELMLAAERIEKGLPLTPDLDQALHHGSSIGGARPKVLIEDNHQKMIAKFSTSSDLYSVVKAEFIAMRLAAISGLNVAPVSLVQTSGKDVLLVERFDRVPAEAGWQRKAMVSALTLFALDEMNAHYASYQDLAEIVRFKFSNPKATLIEIFSRISFNILSGNTDDHARNHAAFWDGKMLSLTPAYDICPQGRAGNEASQAMLISGSERMSTIASCLNAAPHFLLDQNTARQIIAAQMRCIGENWMTVCSEANLSEIDRRLFWGRQFLNQFAFTSLTDEAATLQRLATEIRGNA